jgi:uncharacterized protein
MDDGTSRDCRLHVSLRRGCYRLMRMLKRIAVAALGLAVLAYLGLAGVLYTQQQSLLFRPDATRVDPASVGLAKVQEVLINAPGQPLLLGWHSEPIDASRPVFLYLHGNAASLARRADRFSFLMRDGAGLLAVSWRGYGGSEGKPGEAGFHEDVASALAFLKRSGIGPERIILFGESLGTGMAVMTAAKTPVKGLILDSPYLSIAEIAAGRYWWLPVSLLLSHPFRADLAAPAVKIPTLAIHCTGDWVTPYAGGRALLSRLGGPHRLITVDRACHVPPFSAGGGEAIAAYVAELQR